MSENLKCIVCEKEFEVPLKTKAGERLTCPNCFAQLSLEIAEGKRVLRCALCKKGVLECGENCEQLLAEKEKRGFFNIKL